MPLGGLGYSSPVAQKRDKSYYDPMTAWKERMALYEQAKGDVGSAFSGIEEITKNSMNQRKADVRADAASREAAAMNQLARVGLANSTTGIGTSLGEGFSRYMNAELNRIDESINQQNQQIQLARAGSLANLAGMNLQSADTYNMANLQAGLQREQTASNEYVNTLDPLLRASGAYVRGTLGAMPDLHTRM